MGGKVSKLDCLMATGLQMEIVSLCKSCANTNTMINEKEKMILVPRRLFENLATWSKYYHDAVREASQRDFGPKGHPDWQSVEDCGGFAYSDHLMAGAWIKQYDDLLHRVGDDWNARLYPEPETDFYDPLDDEDDPRTYGLNNGI